MGRSFCNLWFLFCALPIAPYSIYFALRVTGEAHTKRGQTTRTKRGQTTVNFSAVVFPFGQGRPSSAMLALSLLESDRLPEQSYRLSRFGFL